MGQRELDLSAGELEVLKVLWDHGPCPVRTVLERLHRRGRRIAYTTVQTVLTRLEQKGCVASDKSGFAFVYRARLTREQVTRSRLRAMVQSLYDGAAGQLALQLVRSERLTRAELEELARLIDELDASGRSKRT